MEPEECGEQAAMVVRITEQVGGKQRVVAQAHVHVGQSPITLEVLQPRYAALLSRTFSAPIVEFAAGFTTPQGSGNAVATYAPGTAEWLVRLPNELVGAGLQPHLSLVGWATLFLHLRVLTPLRHARC